MAPPVWDTFEPAGFAVPDDLSSDFGTDLAGGKRYDRLLWKAREGFPPEGILEPPKRERVMRG